MDKKKIAFSFLFFIALLALTFYTVLSNENIFDIMKQLRRLNFLCLVICFGFVILYFILQGIFMKVMLKALKKNVSLIKCIYYSIVEFFFSGITPSSTGGQPLQLYYMTKDKIPMNKSVIVLLFNTIVFKLYLIVFGYIILFMHPKRLFFNGLITFLFVFGLIVDTAILCIYLVQFKNPKIIKKLINLINKAVLKITHNKKDISEHLEVFFKGYVSDTDFIKQHKFRVFISILITFIQRTLLFSIPYVIYRFMGINDVYFIDLLVLQIFIQLTIEGLPLPGGTGAFETISQTLYISLFGELALTSMLLTRSISFYIPLILIMIIVVIVSKKHYKI